MKLTKQGIAGALGAMFATASASALGQKTAMVVGVASTSFAYYRSEDFIIMMIATVIAALCGWFQSLEKYTLLGGVSQSIVAMLCGGVWVVFCHMQFDNNYAAFGILGAYIISYNPEMLRNYIRAKLEGGAK